MTGHGCTNIMETSMIKIDEIYQSLFVPYCKSFSKNLELACHDPFGRTDIDSIKVYSYGNHSEHKKIAPPHNVGPMDVANYIYIQDQEPVDMKLQQDTLAEIKSRALHNRFAMITSELNSIDVAQLHAHMGGKQFYYFFHGWAALDWFRGYDKSYLIEDPYKRTITKTFFSPNRIIGGARDHRVAMLYWFEKLKLMHNHISAPKICPEENVDIIDIGHRMSKPYPDITHVLKDMQLPRTFENEHTQLMTSFELGNFKECAESMVYHVTETVAAGYKQHFTEKIFKPIALQMPFVLTGTAGALKYLQGYGFQTFESIWDESYDLVDDDYQRYEKIAHLLFQLDSLNTKEKEDTFTRCLPIIQHNYNHFYGGTFEEILWNELKGMLKSLNDYFSN